MMIKYVVKRDGSKQEFQPSKLNKWGSWAAETLGGQVDWTDVVMQAVRVLPEECTSKELQEALIRACLDLDTWSYNRMAGRLYAPLLCKEVYGEDYSIDNMPTVKQVHKKLLDAGIMVELNYSDEEYEYVNTLIDHHKDLRAAHFELQNNRQKYALRNRVTGKEYETQQFIYMRMAMALAEDQPKDRRMDDLVKWYTYFSDKKINAPTPNYTNLGTPLKGFASCLLYTTQDTWKSLAAGDHIAYAMTCASAGIGSHLNTRSLGEQVRGGAIKHGGKLPYYRALVGAINANLQGSRGGSATVHHTAYDPEVETILQLKNPMSTDDRRIRGLDYSMGCNKFLARKAARNEEVFLFNSNTAPDLWDALYSEDSEKFEEIYNKYDKSDVFVKTYVKARDIVLESMNQAFETGRSYLHWLDEMNTHTPFKESIYSSNLCVAPDTWIYTNEGNKIISELVGQTVTIWNGREWSDVEVVKTGENQKLFRVKLSGNVVGDNLYLDCTAYHKWFVFNDSTNSYDKVETKNLKVGDLLIPFAFPNSGAYVKGATVESVAYFGNNDTYCVKEPKRGMAVFNGILTGQCQEIMLPTSGYPSVEYLYRTDDHGQGELGLCSLAGILHANIESEEELEDVAYYSLLMIDKCIHMSEYSLPHLGFTAKQRMSAGVGIIGLAHLMAKEGKSYKNQEGRDFIHEVAEKHYYYLLKASLRLGKELGNAGWMHKTKWPEGWLPIDSYNKNVDGVISTDLKLDWETLRKNIIANGGIRNSVLAAMMPSESSSKSSGTTNGIYPIRRHSMLKSDGISVISWAAPDSDTLKDNYETVWGIPTEDMINLYAIVQKFTDQGISGDLFRRILGDETVKSSEMLRDFLYMTKMGLKTRYYTVTESNDGSTSITGSGSSVLDTYTGDGGEGCSGGGCTL